MRPWRDIARELARETDRKRILELTEELNRAMEEQRVTAPADSHGVKSQLH
jgi:hypothetical protein